MAVAKIAQSALLVVAALLVAAGPSSGFVVGPTDGVATTSIPPTRQTPVIYAAEDNQEEEEADLFDYFDPLRSPHEYPDGIKPKQDSSSSNSKDETQDARTPKEPKLPKGLDLMGSEFPTAFASPFPSGDMLRSVSSSSSGADNNEALDESLHEFVVEETTNGSSRNNEETVEEDEDEEEEVDILEVFDPTLSPHAYPHGIPSTKKKSAATKKVGILLMDHGSRNKASNQRLHDLAQLYQANLGASSSESGVITIVKAAHMEIAEPSIPEQLDALLKEGVTEIICHPYFLSPGRHVVEDIPEILRTAISDLKIQIPITTTNPVGSNTDLMIHAIHALVEQSSTTPLGMPKQNKFGF